MSRDWDHDAMQIQRVFDGDYIYNTQRATDLVVGIIYELLGYFSLIISFPNSFSLFDSSMMVVLLIAS